MIIREYKPKDFDALVEIWRKQGVDYVLPDFTDPRFVCRRILENGTGRPEMAMLFRLTSEAYLLLDHEVGTPADRLEHLKALGDDAEQEMLAKGFQDFSFWLPPEMQKSFGRRLENAGFVKDSKWIPYTKRLVPFIPADGV